MALRKPSDLFNKKETSGVFESPEVSSHITESYDKFRDNFDKVNQLSEKVEFLSQELSEKLTKSDLENAMLSQLMVLDENFKALQNQVKGLNKQDLKEFKETVVGLSEIVDNLVETELPKYKKQITKSELYVGEQVNQLQGIVESNISEIREEIDGKFDNIAEVVDNNIEYFNQKLEETSSQVKKTSETYAGISKILENKVYQENKKFDEYSELIDNLSEAFEQLSDALKVELNVSSQLTEEKFEEYKKEFESISSNLKTSVDVRLEDYHKEILDIKADVVISEQHIKNVDKYIQEHHQELIELKEEVFTEIEKLSVGNIQENIERLEKKIDYIKETYSKIEPEIVVKEVIKEGLLNEPPSTDNSDPLTSLDKNFVTLDQLQEHYRLFINRIQQQLSTIGGGGETRLKYLDDIVGIATNASAYDNKYLRYNHSLGKFEFADVDISNDSWTDGVNGLYTLGSVGIKTISPQSALEVRGTISIGRTDVAGINSIRSVVDINSWEYGGVFKSVATEDTAPVDICFKDDGTKMYILGDTGNDVNEYSLSTAWDVNTATFTTTFSVASQETNPTGLYFKPDGTRMYICGQTGVSPTGDYARSYTLSTPWDISTASYDSILFNVGTQDITPQGIYLKNDDGTKMYIVGSTGDAVYEYSLGTAWDVSTATFTTSLLVGAANTQNLLLTLTTPVGIDFNASGTKMYIIDSTRDVVARFDLSTPWDISTAVFFDNVYIGFQELAPTGVYYQEDQSRAYIIGSGNDTVYQFNTDVPSLELASSGISTARSIILNNEARLNNRLYVTGDTHISSPVTLKSTLQVDSSATISATLSHTGTTGNINNTTSANTLNLATGAVGSNIIKTINVGTGGASNSRTLITVGSATAGAISTVTIPSPTNFGIGTATPTAPLHVVGNALLTGISTVGLGATSTPPSNSQMSFELTSDTNLRIKVRGSDGVLRSADITLA